MQADRVQVIDNTDVLTSTVTTDPVDIKGWGQMAIEIDPTAIVGGLKIIVELSPDGSAFYPEPIEDPSGVTPASDTFTVPVYKLQRELDCGAAGEESRAFQVPCAGYQSVRLKVIVGTSGTATIYIHKLRLAAN
jgi:hypothetical protein